MTEIDSKEKQPAVDPGISPEPAWNTPWDYLITTARAIGENRSSSGSAEQPLIGELTHLGASLPCPGGSLPQFPLLTELLQRHGCKNGLRLLRAVEKSKYGSKKYRALVKKLLNTLNKLRWEGIWREAYETVKAHTEYPAPVEALCPQELLESTRGQISQQLAQYGYSGTYPAFHRKKFLPGLHLAESCGVCYAVGMKRDTVFHIHCFESVENGVLRIRFLTGTALPRKTETAPDIFSCLFNARGRRFANTVEYRLALDSRQPDSTLAQCVKAAVKKAALRGLSRQEKKTVGQTPKAGFGTFVRVFFLSGGGFALSLAAVLAVLSFAAMYFVDGLDAATAFFLRFPWWIFLASAWLLYGLPIAAMTVVAKNK